MNVEIREISRHWQTLRSLLSCPICLELRKSSTTTRCGHSFCHSCILDWIKVRGKKGKVKCPTCKEDGVTRRSIAKDKMGEVVDMVDSLFKAGLEDTRGDIDFLTLRTVSQETREGGNSIEERSSIEESQKTPNTDIMSVTETVGKEFEVVTGENSKEENTEQNVDVKLGKTGCKKVWNKNKTLARKTYTKSESTNNSNNSLPLPGEELSGDDEWEEARMRRKVMPRLPVCDDKVSPWLKGGHVGDQGSQPASQDVSTLGHERLLPSVRRTLSHLSPVKKGHPLSSLDPNIMGNKNIIMKDKIRKQDKLWESLNKTQTPDSSLRNKPFTLDSSLTKKTLTADLILTNKTLNSDLKTGPIISPPPSPTISQVLPNSCQVEVNDTFDNLAAKKKTEPVNKVETVSYERPKSPTLFGSQMEFLDESLPSLLSPQTSHNILKSLDSPDLGMISKSKSKEFSPDLGIITETKSKDLSLSEFLVKTDQGSRRKSRGGKRVTWKDEEISASKGGNRSGHTQSKKSPGWGKAVLVLDEMSKSSRKGKYPSLDITAEKEKYETPEVVSIDTASSAEADDENKNVNNDIIVLEPENEKINEENNMKVGKRLDNEEVVRIYTAGSNKHDVENTTIGNDLYEYKPSQDTGKTIGKRINKKGIRNSARAKSNKKKKVKHDIIHKMADKIIQKQHVEYEKKYNGKEIEIKIVDEKKNKLINKTEKIKDDVNSEKKIESNKAESMTDSYPSVISVSENGGENTTYKNVKMLCKRQSLETEIAQIGGSSICNTPTRASFQLNVDTSELYKISCPPNTMEMVASLNSITEKEMVATPKNTEKSDLSTVSVTEKTSINTRSETTKKSRVVFSLAGRIRNKPSVREGPVARFIQLGRLATGQRQSPLPNLRQVLSRNSHCGSDWGDTTPRQSTARWISNLHTPDSFFSPELSRTHDCSTTPGARGQNSVGRFQQQINTVATINAEVLEPNELPPESPSQHNFNPDVSNPQQNKFDLSNLKTPSDTPVDILESSKVLPDQCTSKQSKNLLKTVIPVKSISSPPGVPNSNLCSSNSCVAQSIVSNAVTSNTTVILPSVHMSNSRSVTSATTVFPLSNYQHDVIIEPTSVSCSTTHNDHKSSPFKSNSIVLTPDIGSRVSNPSVQSNIPTPVLTETETGNTISCEDGLMDLAAEVVNDDRDDNRTEEDIETVPISLSSVLKKHLADVSTPGKLSLSGARTKLSKKRKYVLSEESLYMDPKPGPSGAQRTTTRASLRTKIKKDNALEEIENITEDIVSGEVMIQSNELPDIEREFMSDILGSDEGDLYSQDKETVSQERNRVARTQFEEETKGMDFKRNRSEMSGSDMEDTPVKKKKLRKLDSEEESDEDIVEDKSPVTESRSVLRQSSVRPKFHNSFGLYGKEKSEDVISPSNMIEVVDSQKEDKQSNTIEGKIKPSNQEGNIHKKTEDFKACDINTEPIEDSEDIVPDSTSLLANGRRKVVSLSRSSSTGSFTSDSEVDPRSTQELREELARSEELAKQMREEMENEFDVTTSQYTTKTQEDHRSEAVTVDDKSDLANEELIKELALQEERTKQMGIGIENHDMVVAESETVAIDYPRSTQELRNDLALLEERANQMRREVANDNMDASTSMGKIKTDPAKSHEEAKIEAADDETDTVAQIIPDSDDDIFSPTPEDSIVTKRIPVAVPKLDTVLEEEKSTLDTSQWRIVTSNLSGKARGMLSKFLSILSCKGLHDKVDDSVTHLIVSTSDNLEAQRTLKYLQAVASGLMVVSELWMESCIKDKTKISQAERWEVTDEELGGCNGPWGSRMRRESGGVPLMKGFEVLVDGELDGLDRKSVEDLLSRAGARTVADQNTFTFTQSVIRLVMVDSVIKMEVTSKEVLRLLRTRRLATIDKDWLLDSLCSHSMRPILPGYTLDMVKREDLVRAGYSHPLV